jgi:hypothetical protein
MSGQFFLISSNMPNSETMLRILSATPRPGTRLQADSPARSKGCCAAAAPISWCAYQNQPAHAAISLSGYPFSTIMLSAANARTAKSMPLLAKKTAGARIKTPVAISHTLSKSMPNLPNGNLSLRMA